MSRTKPNRPSFATMAREPARKQPFDDMAAVEWRDRQQVEDGEK